MIKCIEKSISCFTNKKSNKKVVLDQWFEEMVSFWNRPGATYCMMSLKTSYGVANAPCEVLNNNNGLIVELIHHTVYQKAVRNIMVNRTVLVVIWTVY